MSRHSRQNSLSVAVKHTLILGTKCDAESSDAGLASLQDAYSEEFSIFPVSILEDQRIDGMRRRVFEALGLLRVYTKTPGQKPDMNDPIILPKGSTLADAAEAVHKDFRARLKFARLWGSGKHDGIMVKRDHVLQDGDIIELHV